MGTTKTRPRAKRSTAKQRRSRDSSTPTRRTKGKNVCRWVERHCVFTQGKWIGKPFRLQGWQRKLIYELFEVREDGLRRYRWALWGLPKKNGKTELAAALALYFLIGDGEPSPLIACAASSEEQADLVFGAAKKMCELSTTLNPATKRYDKVITVPSIPGAELKRVAAAAGANDGPSWYVVIADELHEWKGAEGDAKGRKGRDCWTVLTNGIGSRDQPLVLQITTAGYDRQTVCFEQYEHCKKIESGEIEDDAYHFFWVEAPEDADYRDPAVWEAANPSFGVTVQPAFFEDQLTKKSENIFRRYFLNQWTESGHAWLPPGAWDACLDASRTIPDGAAVYVAVDVGLKHDTSSVAVVHDDGERIVARATVFHPPKDGQALRLSVIEAHIRELAETYQVMGVVYDPWNFTGPAQNLEDEGLLVIPFPFNNERTAPASASLYEAVIEQTLVHDGDAILAAHVAAGTTKDTERGWRLTKAASAPCDALTALMMGHQVVAENTDGGVPEVAWS